MSKQPFNFYVEAYNMVGKSRHKAAYRFSKNSWVWLMRYRQWEIEDAVKAALEQPSLALLKQARHMRLECDECVTKTFIGGAAMTSWVCTGCRHGQVSGSTHHGIYCQTCALNRWECAICGKSLDSRLDAALNQQDSNKELK